MLASISSKFLGLDSNGIPVAKNNERPIEEQFQQIDKMEATSFYLGATRLYIFAIEKDQPRTEAKFMSMINKSDVDVSLIHNFCLQMQKQGYSGASILLGLMPETEDKENIPNQQRSSKAKRPSERVPKQNNRYLSPVPENLVAEIAGDYPYHSSIDVMQEKKIIGYPNHSSFSAHNRI
jgi:hypothetical protein